MAGKRKRPSEDKEFLRGEGPSSEVCSKDSENRGLD